MESDVVTWKIVPNTVANRMRNHSFIHKLLPSRRLRRRSKAMNVAIKQSRNLKSYSHYVKMKTAILRNVLDDSETEADDIFTEDDYAIFYKSKLSLINYRTRMSTGSKYSFKVELESDDNDIVSNKRNKNTRKKSKNKSFENVNIGWQKVVIEKNKSACLLTRKKTRSENNSIKYPDSICSQMDNDTGFPNCSQKNASHLKNEVLINTESCMAEKSVELCANISINSGQEMPDTSVLQEIANNSSESINSDSRINEISEEKFQLDENRRCNMLESSKVQTQNKRKEKKNLPSLLYNADEIHSGNDSYTDAKTDLDQDHLTCLDKKENITEASVDEFAENDKSHKIESSIIINTCQPKDSGIEEDTEEEFPEHGDKDYRKVKYKTRRKEQNISDTSFPLNYKSNSTDNGVNIKLENHNMSNKSDFTDTTLFCKYKNASNVEEHEEKVQKHKLQPKVTHTEIVNTKYKIIPCSTPLSNICANLEESSMNDYFYERVHEREEAEQSMENNTSASTKKRLQKLRKLNLTVDSDSSLSENDDTPCNVENSREKLLKRSDEYSSASDDEDENVDFNREISIQFDKELENELSLASNKPVEEKWHSLDCSRKHNFDQEVDVKKSNENNPGIKNRAQAVNKTVTIHRRPCNV
ncbi:hypothetical protein WH47_11214 [Habropoda laboriosa]|uniref:Uncharacterized protein n=1 Tax=Habropoda laboriosa TaxID=597456 RepID=A0A0L7QKH6_9HYME|nr:hypothetical protein WH47_11214 [Habropoda laboriosa]